MIIWTTAISQQLSVKTDMQGMLFFSVFWKMQDGAYVLGKGFSIGKAELNGCRRASLAT